MRKDGDYRPLSEVKAGERCTVIRLDVRPVERLRRLVALGVMPGTTLELQQVWPALVFKMGFGEFAVDSELASGIIVVVHPLAAAEDSR